MRFFNTVAPWLIVMGFTQGKNDPCMFVNDKTGITVALHVDDGLVSVEMSMYVRYMDIMIYLIYLFILSFILIF